jgi:N-hydroxyarylamine O-acetyltransferase
MRLQHYFDRIGYRGERRPTLATLCALQHAHVTSVPFENLDVQLGRPLTIDAEAAYEKIVNRGRGGWCYEQNSLFGWALSEVGFKVTRLAAAVMRQDRGDASRANHLCLLVNCADTTGNYLADVGFGGSMIKPVRLEQSEHTQPPFRLGLKRLSDRYWRFWEDLGRGAFSFDFIEKPASEVALAEKCDFLQNDPSSGFVLNLVVQLRSPLQHMSLRGRVLSIATVSGTESQTLGSGNEIVATLAERFHLDMPEAADLWPKIVARHEALLNSGVS